MNRFINIYIKRNNITRLGFYNVKRFFSYNEKKVRVESNNEEELHEEDFEFDNEVPTALTFDLSVEDEWKSKEEKEYNNYIKRNIQDSDKENKEFLKRDTSNIFSGYCGNGENGENGKIFEIGEKEENDKIYKNRKEILFSDYENNFRDEVVEKNRKSIEEIKEMILKKNPDDTIFIMVLDTFKEDSNIIYEIDEEIINTFFNNLNTYFEKMSFYTIIHVMKILDELNMKNRIRDLYSEMLKILKKGSNLIYTEKEKMKLCLHFISILNNSSLYFSEFYEFLTKHIHKMETNDLPIFANECFKHSLRCKHFLDKIYSVCIDYRNDFNMIQLQSLYNSFHLFCKEYASFYNLTLPIIEENIAQFDLKFLQLLLKIANNFRNDERYNKLVGFVSSQLSLTAEKLQRRPATTSDMKKKEQNLNIKNTSTKETLVKEADTEKEFGNIEEENIVYLVQCLKYLEHDKRNNAEAKKAVNCIYELLNNRSEYIKKMNVEELVYAIVCFCSYNKRIILYNNFLDALCEKSNELIHAKNICLWAYPLLSLSKISWFHYKYLFHIFNFIKDSYILNRLSVFQLLKLLSSLVKMNVYDEMVYKTLIERLYKEWDVIEKKFIDVATFLWSCAYVNIIYKPLFDESYKMIEEQLNSNTYDWNNVIYKNCFVNITWSFIISGYHKTEKNFEKFLDVTFLNRNPEDTQAFKRLHQIADACFKEIPNCLVKVQCLDTMYAYCMHEKCKTVRNEFSVYKKEKDAIKIKKQILDELIQILRKFKLSFSLAMEPYYNAPYIIDIVLNEKLKIGICIFGKEHIMRTLDVPSWSYMNTGFVSLQLRILHDHGWKIIPINAGEWLQLNTDQKTSMLKDIFNQNCIHL